MSEIGVEISAGGSTHRLPIPSAEAAAELHRFLENRFAAGDAYVRVFRQMARDETGLVETLSIPSGAMLRSVAQGELDRSLTERFSEVFESSFRERHMVAFDMSWTPIYVPFNHEE